MSLVGTGWKQKSARLQQPPTYLVSIEPPEEFDMRMLELEMAPDRPISDHDESKTSGCGSLPGRGGQVGPLFFGDSPNEENDVAL